MSVPESDFRPGWFVRFRQSKWFLRTLFLFCSGWILWNLLPATLHFDGQDFGRLTMILSIEASVAACFILEDGGRQLQILLGILRNHDQMFHHLEELIEMNCQQNARIEALVQELSEINGKA